MSDLRWHIVMAKSRAEWHARKYLLKQGIEAFLPWQTRDVRQGHWEHCAEQIIYPGYLFAGLKAGQTVDTVERTAGVRGVLRQGNELVIVPRLQMESIKRECSELFQESLPRVEHPYVPVIGDVVTIPYGAFMGVPAIINAIDNSGNLSASLGNLEVTFHLSALRTSERGRRNALSNNGERPQPRYYGP